jgi:hypothetical protein
MFNRYAKPLKLNEMILIILHVASYQDPYYVQSVWHELFASAEEEALQRGSRPIDLISDKVRSLGMKLSSDESIFPVPYIVNVLETMAYEKRSEYIVRGWVASVLRNAGIPYDVIFSAFNALFESKVQIFFLVDH